MTEGDRTEETIPVRVERRTRRYDSERGCYVYDISFKTRAHLNERTIEVAKAFGLGVDEEREHVLYRDFELRLAVGDVVYITGDSGSGKSILLKAIKEDLGEKVANLDDFEIDEDEPIIDNVGSTFSEALSLLSRVGLNDAFLFLRDYRQLSDGQRYRYRIARMIDEGKEFWLADEFCSTLDRTTARVVAYNIQKLARRSGATLIVATTHMDLEDDLTPSIRVRKGWGEEIDVEYKINVETPLCTVIDDVEIREGSREDYHRLSHLHYRDEKLPVPRCIYAMERKGELIGVIVYSYPAVRASGRKKAVGYSPDIAEINRDWTVISRVVIHPKYRTIGLGNRIIRETLPLQSCRHVELIAVMAQYNPFAERAGMRPIQIKEPHPSITRAVEEIRTIGFNPTRTASPAYNKRILETLPETKLEAVKNALLSVGTLYYKRLSGTSKPYLRKNEFTEWLGRQKNEDLARPLRVLNTLNQTKAYLYWNTDTIGGEGGVT